MNENMMLDLICKSLKDLLDNDKILICKNSNDIKDVKEECINHRFACHLEKRLNDQNYNVDVEYDKNGEAAKKAILKEDGTPEKIRPDIIIHKRLLNGSQNNLIAFEAKKGCSKKRDKEKILALLKSPFEYEWGALVSYLPNKEYIRVKLISKDDPHFEKVFCTSKKN